MMMNKIGRCGYIKDQTPSKIKIKRIDYHEHRGSAVKLDYPDGQSRITYFLFNREGLENDSFHKLTMESKFTANAFIRKVLNNECTVRMEIDGLWLRETFYEPIDEEEGFAYTLVGRRSVSLPVDIMTSLEKETVTEFESRKHEGLMYISKQRTLIQSAHNRTRFKSIKLDDYVSLDKAFKAAFVLGKSFKERIQNEHI